MNGRYGSRYEEFKYHQLCGREAKRAVEIDLSTIKSEVKRVLAGTPDARRCIRKLRSIFIQNSPVS